LAQDLAGSAAGAAVCSCRQRTTGRQNLALSILHRPVAGGGTCLAATAVCPAAEAPAYFMFEQKSPKGETEQFTFKLTDPARIAESRKILVTCH